ncbi:hypothetical protein N658DRAFT_564245 [Parathielavia hyrcaniae]|uniref:Clock-controlled pheromone ccg-4 n=1 Tax=Parathielavia hyrcaniae TaxID=113614 RepID=A0AAN6Q9A0_9PEZI|nr:hypothetical protein N658DRAFT_564245 [Parathielavia hyrcaniae]
MKFTLPVTLLAVAASASVVDHDKRYCQTEGQSCDTNDKISARDETNGETAWIVNRQLHELALSIAATRDEPDHWYRSLTPSRTAADKATEKSEAEPWCTRFLGQPCWGKRSDEDAVTPAKRDVATAVKRETEPWCTRFLGQPCWGKRAEEEATPVKRDDSTPVKRAAEPWCTRFLGQPCWGKRDAEPYCTASNGQPCWTRSVPEKQERQVDWFCTRFAGSSCWKRDGSEAVAEEVKRCSGEGQACWKAKRAASAVIDAIEQGNALKMARDADPAYCTRCFGGPCWKRDASCNSPAGICTKATRDLHAMCNAARAIIDA